LEAAKKHHNFAVSKVKNGRNKLQTTATKRDNNKKSNNILKLQNYDN
jgi:hypothetical protein